MNTVQLIGRLTADPDIRAGEKHECASFRLAVPRRSADRDAADFIDIVKLQVVADDVSFLDKPKNGKGEPAAEEAPEIPDRPAVGSYRRKAG
jgi:single-stranded DNA-binding protein